MASSSRIDQKDLTEERDSFSGGSVSKVSKVQFMVKSCSLQFPERKDIGHGRVIFQGNHRHGQPIRLESARIVTKKHKPQRIVTKNAQFGVDRHKVCSRK